MILIDVGLSAVPPWANNYFNTSVCPLATNRTLAISRCKTVFYCKHKSSANNIGVWWKRFSFDFSTYFSCMKAINFFLICFNKIILLGAWMFLIAYSYTNYIQITFFVFCRIPETILEILYISIF